MNGASSVRTGAWDSWLDDLSRAAAALEQQLADGDLLDFPELTPPPLDGDPAVLPAEMLDRARRLLDRLERLERIATTQRDKVANELRTLAVPRPRPTAVRSYELGSSLDVAG